MRKSDQFNAAIYIAIFGTSAVIGTYLLAKQSFLASLLFGLAYIAFWLLFWALLRAELRLITQPTQRFSSELWNDPRFVALAKQFGQQNDRAIAAIRASDGAPVVFTTQGDVK